MRPAGYRAVKIETPCSAAIIPYYCKPQQHSVGVKGGLRSRAQVGGDALETGRSRCGRGISSIVGIAALHMAMVVAHGQVPTTLDNFFHPGTQPDTSNGKDFAPIVSANQCGFCHEMYDPTEVPVYSRWQGSMHANSARDPLFHASLAIANQDVAFSGDLCIRCHSPGGWLGGRSTPTDGSALQGNDFEGVTCNFCHRMVDPVFNAGVSPPRDELLLDALASAGLLPLQSGNGGYVVDPDDVRRGPFDDVPFNFHGVDIVYSPFHSESDKCATCHDVSNPAYVRQPDGSYALNALGVEHPTLDKFDMFPLERTFSEWANSTYATIGVDAGGVFGGNHPTGVMRTCQDCHMPDTQAYGCIFEEPYTFERQDVPAHDFNGGNAWMQSVLYNLYPGVLQPQYLADSQDRAHYMLENAATLEVTPDTCSIKVRIINETGHKLPTGYPEGRRMWINVEFRDESLNVLASRGEYASASADLTTSDTKVFEAKLGPDAAIATLAGLPEEPSFHFALNNKYYKDNRIPPRGFSNAAFAAVQAAPVAATYDDGQYWDDTLFRIPPATTTAIVSVYYQTASKEYITFLRDENHTNDAGDVLYEQWELTGKSPPVLMNQQIIADLVPGIFADADCNDQVNLDDLQLMSGCVTGPGRTLNLGCEALDADLDGDVDLQDLAFFQLEFGPLE